MQVAISFLELTYSFETNHYPMNQQVHSRELMECKRATSNVAWRERCNKRKRQLRKRPNNRHSKWIGILETFYLGVLRKYGWAVTQHAPWWLRSTVFSPIATKLFPDQKHQIESNESTSTRKSAGGSTAAAIHRPIRKPPATIASRP